MRNPIYCNKFTALITPTGECYLRFLAEWPCQDNEGNLLTYDDKAKGSVRPLTDGESGQIVNVWDDQYVIMSIENLKLLHSKISVIIDTLENPSGANES